MTNFPRPEPIPNAPGLVVRERKRGWFIGWQCRSDIAARGFKPTTLPLWRGETLSELDRENIASQCQMIQAEMLRWANDDAGRAPSEYDGTVLGLVERYKHDKHSPYKKLRYHSRENYGHFLRRIVADHGDERIADLKGRDMMTWHEAWVANGKIPMAHSLMRAFRGLLSFGISILDDDDCARLSSRLKEMRFPMGKPRESTLSAEQANAIRAKAHEMGWPSMALAQAIQFEGMLRQKDVIGEWVPINEPGASDVMHDSKIGRLKWLRGIRWSEIDQHLVLRHITSKRQKAIEIRLGDAPMVVEELNRLGELPTSGPVIVCEDTGRPYSATHFRQVWREIATACGVPKTIRNQDSRAGAITEATDSGASLEDVRHAATHSDVSMTQRYSRGSADKTATVLKMRVAHRNKSGT